MTDLQFCFLLANLYLMGVLDALPRVLLAFIWLMVGVVVLVPGIFHK